MAKVVLKKGRERSLIRRHPWIFSGAIESADEGVEAGDIVEVVSAGGATLGFGAYSPASQIRIRMLIFGH
ncbi:MAG: 23S rRNA (cytosine(1962)-C(5))-methyltransferase RlmI, partial [Kiritimatiellae bacterium]|nr:23S rRNA (cytosine(1962)-C(5))-methyltransferase RlmI [Kiritimatiellia bacterium]